MPCAGRMGSANVAVSRIFCGIEEHEIGVIALANAAALRKAEALRGHGGHFVDGGGEAR